MSLIDKTQLEHHDAQQPKTNIRDQLAALLKAAGDDLRLGILQVLARDSYGVLELASAFQTKQSGISHHLKVLANAGLVCTRREGNSVFYRRPAIAANDPFARAKLAIYAQVDQLPLPDEIAQALQTLWQERTQASEQFFQENADKFKAQQDLIASFETYESHVTELLNLAELPSRSLALEIGPGTGDYLVTLATLFDQVIALDNNAQMLQQAKTTAKDFSNIDYVLGDTSMLPKHLGNNQQVDCVVINMVLHHTPSPAQVIADATAQLKTGGILLITELRSHDQTWAREACGDIWLGFEPDDFAGWADNANLQSGQSTYLALRNGFQIQIHQLTKQ